MGNGKSGSGGRHVLDGYKPQADIATHGYKPTGTGNPQGGHKPTTGQGGGTPPNQGSGGKK